MRFEKEVCIHMHGQRERERVAAAAGIEGRDRESAGIVVTKKNERRDGRLFDTSQILSFEYTYEQVRPDKNVSCS